ncbi:MAG: hypothetical protein KKB30_05370 [Proteobacteria bacterium]|nr:hypothetical protein [Pseudomonadota bacterium]MBU1716129.1 hypothetical protein [Pseudomonadota bacterium]
MNKITILLLALIIILSTVFVASADTWLSEEKTDIPVFRDEEIISPSLAEVEEFIFKASKLAKKVDNATSELLGALDTVAIEKAVEAFESKINSDTTAELTDESPNQSLLKPGLIDTDILGQVLARKMAKVARIALRRGLKKAGKSYDDLALDDIADTAANELLNSITSSRSDDKLIKAIIRYVVVSASAEAIKEKVKDVLSGPTDEITARRISRNIAYIALSEVSRMEKITEFEYLRLDRLGFSHHSSDTLLKKLEIEKSLRDEYIRQANLVKEYYINLLKDVGVIHKILKSIESNLDKIEIKIRSKGINEGERFNNEREELIQKIVDNVHNKLPTLDSTKYTFLEIIIGLINPNERQETNNPTRKIFQETRELIYTGLDKLSPDCCFNDESTWYKNNAKECLPLLISHAVLDNLEYDENENKFVFDSQGAISPIAEQAGSFGGKSDWFFHLVIGMGSAQIDGQHTISMTSEQIGLGYKFPWARTRHDGIVTKMGAFASGLLYKPNIDGEDKDVTMGGLFIAFDVLETVQLNLSYYKGYTDDGESFQGSAIGFFIPLGEYLAELAGK